ncbi:MAG: zf-HC2 domain-containing protein [bacterium]|nr:zf-HC2 domain-containing protein [bacterium]
MNTRCTAWEALLDAYLGGDLDGRDEAFFQSHAAACDRCRDLLRLVSDDLPALADPAEAQLADGVIAVTSGPACGRAEALLGARPDGNLSADETLLLQGHLDHCRACADLAVTLEAALATVRELAEPELDPSFTYDVLRATSATRARKRSGALPRLTDRLGAWWQGQAARPQFAWEAAFAATVVLVLLFGTPLSPARRAPARALAAVQASPAWMIDTAGELTGAAGTGIGVARRDVTERRNRTAPDRADLLRHSREAGAALLHGDLDTAAKRLHSAGGDLARLWDVWRDDGTAADGN